MEKSSKSVYQTLLEVDVSDYIEVKEFKRHSFNYLSWVWAWHLLKTAYSDAKVTVHTFEFDLPFVQTVNGDAFVCVTASAGGDSYTEWYPVLDHQNKAIKTPDSFQVNNSIQRAKAKAIACLGMGLSVFAGEDLAQYDDAVSDSQVVTSDKQENVSASQVEALKEACKIYKVTQKDFCSKAAIDKITSLPSSRFDKAMEWLAKQGGEG